MDLRKFPLFESLPENELRIANGLLRVKNFARREVVCRKQEAADGMYLLFSGQLQAVDIAEDGREIGLNLIKPGAFFGELSVIDGLPRSAHIIALQPSVVGVIPQNAAREIFYKLPAAAEAMMRHLTALVRNLSTYRTLLAIPNAQQRVYALLQQLGQQMPGGLNVIQNLPKQQEVAIMINTSRETVSRAIAHLVAIGVLEKDFRRLIVRDPQRLRLMALHAPGLPLKTDEKASP
ncbi:Crp/Fnr family transcriptional regulator [uncultured Ramlibacter sp.]|uniref:Crp/Fnr family transcriptional regulator n=1 Tax=uncultured Ramlibacter sp. TaxID=260755 RepID=UPI0026115B45|nr:Crp/Fnr family transcriptional regulator [uncultured Ramlibacter sp.]